METRKMQLIGRGSFSITLPPDWVKEYKLKPSDQITITREDDGTLRLAPGITREEKKEIKITIGADRNKDSGLLGLLIVGGYVKGCDLIEVVSKRTLTENQRREINEATNGLIGMGIVESNSNHIVLQCLVDASKFPLGQLLKRMYDLVFSMQEDTMKALKDKDSSLAANVVQRENEVSKINSLVRRQLIAASIDKSVLKKIGLKGPTDLTYHTVMAPKIWRATYLAVDSAINQLALDRKAVSDTDLQKIIRLGEMANKIFSDACKSFFKEDAVLANNTINSFKPFDKRKDDLIKDLGPRLKDTEVAVHIMNIIRDISGIARSAMEIADVTIFHYVTEKSNLL